MPDHERLRVVPSVSQVEAALQELADVGLVATCDWADGACPFIPTERVERDGEARQFCEVHADMDRRIRLASPGERRVIDPPDPLDEWQAGWRARSQQAHEDCADTAAREYDRGFADADRIPTFTTACVCLTLAFTAGFVVALWLFG